MDKYNIKGTHELTEHFFRNEYGKIVSVVTRYIGTDNVQTAEDIVQETLLKAVDHWQQNGIPENPKAWLYTAAKNHTLNILKRKKHILQYQDQHKHNISQDQPQDFHISEDMINDEQLKMMFVCCHPSISENSQITLMLKILCGFSISEIANAFFTTSETINKRLVRGRKQLRDAKISFEIPKNNIESLDIVLKTIYLLFNEGYSPSQQNKVVRYDLCLEAIRLAELLYTNQHIVHKSNTASLLALMYLNVARFEARNDSGNLIEMHKQDRMLWNTKLINRGIHYLNQTTKDNTTSVYQILATISAHHCIAPSFEDTNWIEILALYDSLLQLQDTPLVRLNRAIPLAKVNGNEAAIKTLTQLKQNSDIASHYLFHATLAEFYKQENNTDKAIASLKQSRLLCSNPRDIELIEKKLKNIVPI
ncbi:RNA polymerase sigma factor [Aquimarina mytili]|uniref:Sigma-70 family RNA polymerase sigma factor n=1 Tax=Aquimarina mytili TaxID=874423 RepID=A0A937DB85_9FLAO|nr:sigma-70 family RNA polymerase sigma factor [Aquimarina mytili]MBL0685482.1 sigma-70 family RNA polymerase sigma factor [Aquimarina mytili]